MFRAKTVREFFVETYQPLRLTGRSEQSARLYLDAIGHLERYAGRPLLLHELRDELVASCLAALIKQGRSTTTANKIRRHLLSLWRLASKRDGIELPDVPALKEPKRVPRAWLTSELGKIVAAAGQMPGEIAGVPAGRWWTALLLVAYDTGLRITPLMQLKWANLDLAHGCVLAGAETQKHGRDETPALSAETLKALAAIRDPPREKIFPWPFDRNLPQWPTLNRHFGRLLRRAGFSVTRKDLWHKIRRTTASYLKAAGGDPTAQLGHSSPKVTEAYLDPRICGRRRQVDLLPRPELIPVQRRLFE